MQYHTICFEEKLGRAEMRNKRIGIMTPEYLAVSDNEILENIRFNYQLVRHVPEGGEYSEKSDSVIILLHGLNERNWSKYIPWAEYLAEHTSKTVLLFPIALHMNRSPNEWNDSRKMQHLVCIEKQKCSSPENLTYLNYALSMRIKADPYRFYLSGRETIMNMCQLAEEIRSGRHNFISKYASIDIFAYSIGALLSQVLLMSNPDGCFSNSKLFMFCGGSLFSEMDGNSKMIMDKESFALLTRYYTESFRYEKRRERDYIENAFIAHIAHNYEQTVRESFYRRNRKRIKAVSLKKDKVVPTMGIRMAMGRDAWTCVEEYDFPFDYSHEIPFPRAGNTQEIKLCFEKIFSNAAGFFS